MALAIEMCVQEIHRVQQMRVREIQMLTLLVMAEAGGEGVLCLDNDFGQGMLGDGVTHRPHRLLMRIPQHGLPSLRR
ncbi:MAG TPA: hypothetical protein VGL78_17470 [Solirubrobacteraceae bacterium]